MTFRSHHPALCRAPRFNKVRSTAQYEKKIYSCRTPASFFQHLIVENLPACVPNRSIRSKLVARQAVNRSANHTSRIVVDFCAKSFDADDASFVLLSKIFGLDLLKMQLIFQANLINDASSSNCALVNHLSIHF